MGFGFESAKWSDRAFAGDPQYSGMADSSNQDGRIGDGDEYSRKLYQAPLSAVAGVA